jgi:hypothetical protein
VASAITSRSFPNHDSGALKYSVPVTLFLFPFTPASQIACTVFRLGIGSRRLRCSEPAACTHKTRQNCSLTRQLARDIVAVKLISKAEDILGLRSNKTGEAR